MAAHQPGIWGIDLGQCALKAIRLEARDGQVVATAFDYIEHPKILSQPDADPDQLTREALEQFLSRNTLRGDMVCISVPGQSGLARFVKLPPVEEKKIADIVKFEAKQQIPFPLEEVVWDFQKLSADSVTGDYVETEIGLFAMKRDMVNRALGQFKDVNVEVHVIQMAPLALCNYVAYDLLGKNPNEPAGEETKECVVALDIGTDNSNLVITDGGKIIWQRPIPLGGNHFTRALTKDLKLTFAKAEHLKRNAAKSPDLKKILASLKAVLNDFVGEVQRSLGYFTNTHRDASIQYMIGLGNAFRLPGLRNYLQDKLQLEVRKLESLQRATGDEVTAAPTFTENILSFGVAYGLALQGLKLARLQTNLLPYEVRVERLVRGKKPWAVAAAAALLLAIAGLTFTKSGEWAAVANEENKRAMDQAKQVIDTANKNKADYEAEEKKIKDAIAALKRLGAGVDDRFNWQLLHQYINMSLPKPNGDNLVLLSNKNERVKEKYFDNPNKYKKEFPPDPAKKAYQLLEAKRFAKNDPVPREQAEKEEEFIKQHLVQINVEGVDAVYSDDLGLYFAKVYQDTNALRGMPDPDRTFVKQFGESKDQAEKDKLFEEPVKESEPNKKKLPKAGWVIEIRGYTYHWDSVEFVENTIIENLKHRPIEGKEMKLPGAIVLNPKQLKEQVKDQLSHLLIYKLEKVKNPQPGQFVHIGKSYLRTLIKGPAAAGGNLLGAGPMPMGDPNAAGGAGAVAGDAAKPSRDAWKPVGEVASTALGEGAGGGGMGVGGGPEGGIRPLQPGPFMKGEGAIGVNPMDPAAKRGADKQPRTEFVVLLVWREPITMQLPQLAGGDAAEAAAPAAPAEAK